LLMRRKVAIVSWSGCRLAATKRTATSRKVARSIRREEKMPVNLRGVPTPIFATND